MDPGLLVQTGGPGGSPNHPGFYRKPATAASVLTDCPQA